MRGAENAESARAEGIAIARQMVERVHPMVGRCAIERAIRTLPMAIDVAEAIGSRE